MYCLNKLYPFEDAHRKVVQSRMCGPWLKEESKKFCFEGQCGPRQPKRKQHPGLLQTRPNFYHTCPWILSRVADNTPYCVHGSSLRPCLFFSSRSHLTACAPSRGGDWATTDVRLPRSCRTLRRRLSPPIRYAVCPPLFLPSCLLCEAEQSNPNLSYLCVRIWSN